MYVCTHTHILYWSIIALQCCDSLAVQGSKSAVCIHISPPCWASLPAHPTPLGHHRARLKLPAHVCVVLTHSFKHTYAPTVTHNCTHSQTHGHAQICEHTTWSMTQLPEGDLHFHYSSLFPSFKSTTPMIVIIIVPWVPPCLSHSARCSLYFLSNTRNQEGGYCDPFYLKCRRAGFDSWIGKIPWQRKWQPTPVSLPGGSHGQRSLAGYSP